MSADAGKTKNSHEALAKMMDGLNLERATIRATDHSLIDRALTVAAQMQGLSVDGAAYRQQMRGALPFLLSTVIPADLARTISPPLQAFLGGGQTLIADLNAGRAAAGRRADRGGGKRSRFAARPARAGDADGGRGVVLTDRGGRSGRSPHNVFGA